MNQLKTNHPHLPLCAALLAGGAQAATNTLSGFALLDANTFAPGPTSGQFTTLKASPKRPRWWTC